MAISYNAGTNTLTLDGVNTYTLENIYQADVGGGWGVVTKVGEMYLFMCNMVIGDAAGNTTKLIDSDVGFQIGVTGTRKYFQTLSGSSFEMTGCILKFWLSIQKMSYGTWKFEKCLIYERETANNCLYSYSEQQHERSTFDVSRWFGLHETCIYDNCLLTASYFFSYSAGIIKSLIFDGNWLYVYNNSPTFENCTIDGGLQIVDAGKHVTFVNSTCNSLVMDNANNYLLDKWEFNVLVSDKDNNPLSHALVILKDKNGGVKHATDTGADGKLTAAWEVLANRYDGTSETKTEYNPFTLTVTKAGYADYETKITIDHIVKDDQIVLDGQTYTYDDIMSEIKKVKGICLVC